MADRITQIQDALDQLATQFYASLRYVLTHHTSSQVDGQPAQPSQQINEEPEPNPQPFPAALTELSRDLIIKEQQIEYLVESLPGVGTSSLAQEKRLTELEEQIREAERERKVAVGERDEMVKRVEEAIKGLRRV